jgi:hypothetical protein
MNDLTRDQSFALKTYLQSGGGIIIFPGSRTTINAFNSSIAVPLGISRAVMSEDNLKSQTANSFIEFDKVDLRHLLFSGMFEESEIKQSTGTVNRQRVLESPRIIRSFHYLPTPKSRSIISLTNGYPFLVEEQSDNGRLLLFSVPANTEWSDLPLKGLFIPLVRRSIAYLAQEPTIEHSVLIGEEKNIHLRTAVLSKLRITKPNRSEIIIDPQQFAGKKRIRFSDDDLPGYYTVASGNLILDKFAVNIDPNESNTAPSDETHRKYLLKRIGITDNSIHAINQPQEGQRVITESRFGAELWKQFLIAAMLIAVIEMFVSRDNKRFISLAGNKQNITKEPL